MANVIISDNASASGCGEQESRPRLCCDCHPCAGNRRDNRSVQRCLWCGPSPASLPAVGATAADAK